MEPVDERRRLTDLYAAHASAVLSYARARTSDQAAAEDAVMEVFVVACRRLSAIPSGAELPWLLGCARRILANQRRSQRRADALVERVRDSLRTRTTDPHLAQAVSDAFARLSQSDQEVLLLAAWEGLTPHELGVALGCSRTAAAVRLHRARRRFRDVFDPVARARRSEPCAEVAQ